MAKAAVIDARRAMVAQLALKGLSQREIVKALKNARIVNPRSGKPWSLATVNNDLKAVQEEWEETAVQARAKMKAQVAAELRLLKRQAWKEKDLKLVAELLKQERQLFGLDAPTNINMKGHLGVDVEHRLADSQTAMETAVAEMDESELDQLIANLLEANGVEADLPAHIFEGEYETVEEE